MVAPWDWCKVAARVFKEQVGDERALLLVKELRKIPTRNGSLRETLERLEGILEKR